LKSATPLLDSQVTFPDDPGAASYGILELCPDTVVKARYMFGDIEARALDFVRSNTSIPVPKVRRFMNYGLEQFILMEKIEGTRLDRLWPSFSPLQRLLVAWTLRGYILELRKASANYHRCHIPGPIADTPQPCRGAGSLFFDREVGPFEGTRQLLDYFSQWPGNNGPRFDISYESQPLVLTHGDLSMRNIIVGRDGKLWLVDWEWAGFYPPFCESIATKSTALNDEAPSSWCRCIPLITGVWAKEEKMRGCWFTSIL
jgi:aminoglycoside phosphotransferase (APT) family kinase protein